MFYRGANAILVVFDKSNKESFDNLDAWVEEFRRFVPSDAIFMIVGNKCDLEPKVSTEQAQEKAMMYQVPYIEVSSKTNEQIDNLFGILASKLVEIEKAKPKE